MKFELSEFNRNVADDELLRDLVSVDAQLKAAGRSLTFRAYKELGKFSPHTISVRFGSWNAGLQKAGLAPVEEKNTPLDVLLDNIRVVWIAKGRQPVYRDMSASPSRFTGSTYNARFGGWREALSQFVAKYASEEHEIASQEAELKIGKARNRTNRDPSLSVRFMVLKRDKFSCLACGRSPATVPSLVLEIDHIHAWSKGGETVPSNLQTLCFECNRGKSAT